MRDSRVVATISQTFDGKRTQATPTVDRDATITVDGRGYTDGCHDVCINGVCPPTFPAKGIRLLFIQGETVELGKIDADNSFRISYKTSLPAGARNGEAAIVTETLYGAQWVRSLPVVFIVQNVGEIR
jgi:hypothetical protein